MDIHFVAHNFSDWDSQTKHMSRIERSIYLDLRTLYFSEAGSSNGKIDSTDFELLCYRLSCRSEEEISALKLLLKDKFKKNGNTYRHSDWDKQIKAIQWEIKRGNVGNVSGNAVGNVGNESGNVQGNVGNVSGNVLSNAERTAKSKAERKKLLSDLASVGVIANNNAPIAELRALHEKHCGGVMGNVGNVSGNAVGNVGNESGNVQGNVGNAQNPSNNYNHNNNHKTIKEDREENSFREEESVLDDEIQAPPSAKLSTAIVIYAKNQGINAAPNQKLNDCIAQGATMDMFTEAIHTAKERGNSRWDYIIGIVKNRVADAEKMAKSATQALPKSGDVPRHFPVNTGHYDKGLIPNGDGSYKF